jgi:hypothetical protein
VVVEEELLNRAGIELAVISELQINLGFGIRLASSVQPEDVGDYAFDANTDEFDFNGEAPYSPEHEDSDDIAVLQVCDEVIIPRTYYGSLQAVGCSQ